MIHGIVRARMTPTVPLTVRNAVGQELAIEALVDTGCSGSLTLPSRFQLTSFALRHR